MPCTFTGSLEGDRALFLREDLDKLTSLLCDLCKRLEKKGRSDIIAANPRLTKWWKLHKKFDAAKKGQ